VAIKDWDYVYIPKLLDKQLEQFLETPRAKYMGMFIKSLCYYPQLISHIYNEIILKLYVYLFLG
jgi:hypothetical protein